MHPCKKFIPAIFIFLFFTANALHAKDASGYYPLRIVNLPANSKNITHTYILLLGQKWDAAATSSVLKLTYSPSLKAQVASLVPITSSTDSRTYSYAIDSLQGYDKATQTITIYIPHLQSGRCMISMNYKLYMPPVLGGGAYSLQEPSISNTSDVNYDIIYDKFEYSYDTTGAQGLFYINPTAVDFFSIPVHLQYKNQSSGANTTTSREQLITTMGKTFTSHDKSANKTWSTLMIKDATDKTILRVAAPNLTPAFDSFYLAPKTGPGFNYISTVIKYYQSNTAVINCFELNTRGSEVFDFYNKPGTPVDKQVTPASDPGAYIFTGKINANKQWIFVNNPKSTSGMKMMDTLYMDRVNTENFFGPGTGAFATPNKTVQSVLVKNITAAFTVNLLPAPNGMLFDAAYLNSKSYPHFAPNKYLNAPANTGPWYDLYSQAVHNAIPVIYAFAYDDVLGQDGTLVGSDTTSPITITFGNMGDIVIPAHKTILPAYPVTPTYNSGFHLVGANYVDTLKWTVPANQPPTAKYFFMLNGDGATYTLNKDSLIKYQVNNLLGNKLYGSAETMGILTLPSSLLKSTAPGSIYMQIFTCGGPNCACTYANLSDSVLCATGSKPIAPPGPKTYPVFPVTLTYNSGFSQSGTNYVVTVNWKNPAGAQANHSNAQYFLMPNGTGGGLSFVPDSIVAHQVGHFASYTDTTATLTIPVSLLTASDPGGVYMQVFTCGAVGCACATGGHPQNFTCPPGSAPLKPSVSGVKKGKKTK